jgi:predicted anti-sigma-YlaC factor YlaD
MLFILGFRPGLSPLIFTQNYDLMTCGEIRWELNDYIDRELTPEEMHMVTTHLTACVICAEQLLLNRAQLIHIRRQLGRIQMPAHLEAEIFTTLSRAHR